ncbi:MAG: DUF554 domain-containing protein [Archaeoglobaceae archaeon]
MLGTIINSTAIIVASLIGLFIGNRIKNDLKDGLIKVLGLCVSILGISMALKMQNFLVVTFSLVLGYAIGDLLGIEKGFERFGKRVEERFKGSKFAEGFVTSTLLFCVGSMAILGPIQEGLTGERSILLAKSLLDGIASLILSSTLGIGVAFSSLSVLLYQGFFTVFAGFISPYLSEKMINELNSTGGVIIFAIGLNLSRIANFKVGNMLPALLFAPLLSLFV